MERNNNKYYILQVHKSNFGNSYQVYIRYGRVGEPGNQIVRNLDLDGCVKQYHKLFKAKTSGGNPYVALEMKASGSSENSQDGTAASTPSKNATFRPSKLDKNQ